MRGLSICLAAVALVSCGGGDTGPQDQFITPRDTILFVGSSVTASGLALRPDGSPVPETSALAISSATPGAFSLQGGRVTALDIGRADVALTSPTSTLTVTSKIGSLLDLRRRFSYAVRCERSTGARDSIISHFAATSAATVLPGTVAVWANGDPQAAFRSAGIRIDTNVVWHPAPPGGVPYADTTASSYPDTITLVADSFPRIQLSEVAEAGAYAAVRSGSFPLTIRTAPVTAEGDAINFCGFSSYGSPSVPRMWMKIAEME